MCFLRRKFGSEFLKPRLQYSTLLTPRTNTDFIDWDQSRRGSRRENSSVQTSLVFADNRFILANTMKLVTVEVDGKARPGRIADDHIIDLSGIGADLRSILESGRLDRARSVEGSKIPLMGARLL